MDGKCNQTLQIFARLLDGKTATLRFNTGPVYGHDIKRRICKITGIPPVSQRLISSGTQLEDKSVISTPDSTVHLVLRLLGGKGGFGSLLRGAATKAGQKKTNNFDACRDMSGRRLRHVNAEKRLEEWKAEEEERRLEKLAEDFIKKEAKKKGGSKAGAADREAQKYVAKYREESAKCVVEVEEAVREACGNGAGGMKRKGKVPMDAADAKKLKIWMGKRKLGESDCEDSSDDDDGEENGKSTLTNNGNYADSNRETEGSLDSVTGGMLGEQSSGGASCESGSEEEKEVAAEQNLKSSPHMETIPNEENVAVQPDVIEETLPRRASLPGSHAVEVLKNDALKAEESGNVETISQLQPGSSGEGETAEHRGADSKSEATEEAVSANKGTGDLEEPLNFDEFNSAADLEVLGMERLKTELQNCGLKCGGTLQERAARLFLLKSTPLEKLPKKLLAKK